MRQKRLIIWFYVILISFSSCQNPLQDFVLTFKDPIADGVYTFTVRDYKGQQISNAEITFLGPAAGQIVNTLGNPNIQLTEEGKFFAAINPKAVLSAEEPLKFAVQISAEGFTSRTYNYSASNRNNRSQYVRLASLTETQNNAAGFAQTYTGASSKVELKNSEAQLLGTVLIPEGQEWKNESGENLGGEAQLDLIVFKPGGKGFMPGSGILENTRDLNGQTITDPLKVGIMPAMIEVIATDREGELITNFSKPIQVDFQLPGFASGQSKTGDALYILSYSENTGKWIMEGETEVGADGTVTVEMKHFSFWVLVDQETLEVLCAQQSIIKAETAYFGLDISYLYRVKNESGQQLRSGYMSLNNGAKLTLKNLPKEGSQTLEIYDYSNFHGGDANNPIAVIDGINCSEETIERGQDIQLLNEPVPIEVDFAVSCPQGQSLNEEALPAQMKVQISSPGQNQFRDLLTFSRDIRSIKTYRLEVGETYDFRVSTDGGSSWPFKQGGYTINRPSWTINVNTDGYCK